MSTHVKIQLSVLCTAVNLGVYSAVKEMSNSQVDTTFIMASWYVLAMTIGYTGYFLVKIWSK